MSAPNFLESQSPKQLLQLTGAVIDELVRRGINRTGNNPLSDYTEWLVTTNSIILHARDSLLKIAGVEDLKARITE